jgi:hypothetical protein
MPLRFSRGIQLVFLASPYQGICDNITSLSVTEYLPIRSPLFRRPSLDFRSGLSRPDPADRPVSAAEDRPRFRSWLSRVRISCDQGLILDARRGDWAMRPRERLVGQSDHAIQVRNRNLTADIGVRPVTQHRVWASTWRRRTRTPSNPRPSYTGGSLSKRRGISGMAPHAQRHGVPCPGKLHVIQPDRSFNPRPYAMSPRVRR